MVRILINSFLSLVVLAVCLMFSWRALSEANFLFPQLYEINGIDAQIAKYGPQNRNRVGFETTTKAERGIIFGEIVEAVNNSGIGLDKIFYRAPSGEVIDSFLTQPEIDHLNDVARLIGYLNKTLLYLTAFLFCLVTFCWTLKVRKNTNIWRPFTVGKSFISMLAVLLLCFAIVTAVGPQRVFYALHEWIFAGMAPWHFYFQDSLMTTMLTEPLFGSISILLVGTAFVFWLLLSALIKRILA